MAGDLERLVAELRRPVAYDHPVGAVEVEQTHISYVVLAGAYAYKVKKPLNLGFLDYSTLDGRRRMCEEEVRLNRRLCDDVYLGVVPITRSPDGALRVGGAGAPVEYAVQMRRVPDELTMPRLLASGNCTRERLAALAAKIGSFHRDAATSERVSVHGRVAALRANWKENFEQTAPFVGRTATRHQIEGVRVYVERFLQEHGVLIEERADMGRVRDGHGDLRADSVVFAPGGSVCVMDCIEFNDRLRCGDIASDVAFLAMDLEFRGHRREADEFVSLYLETLGADETLPVVLNFYRTYRAFVRGKVDSMQSDEAEVPPAQRADAAQRASRYFQLALAYAGRVFPQALIMMVGLSGTGKSFVARALACHAGAALLSTDLIRRDRVPAQSPRPGPYAAGAYAPEQREAAYVEMLDRARRHLALNRSVVLDATFLTQQPRAAARQLAVSTGVPLLAVHVVAPEDAVRGRLAARTSGASSDARWATYVSQRSRFEPLENQDLPYLVTLDGTLPIDRLVDEVLCALEAVPKSGHSAGPPPPNGP